MFRFLQTYFARRKRLEERRYFISQLEHLRFRAEGLHHPWYDQNPWARGLRHGQLYVSPRSPDSSSPMDNENMRLFRLVLQFDPSDFDRWKRMAKEIPRDRFMDAFSIPVRWEWMIEEMTRGTIDVTEPLPATRRPIDRETFEKLKRTDASTRIIDNASWINERAN